MSDGVMFFLFAFSALFGLCFVIDFMIRVDVYKRATITLNDAIWIAFGIVGVVCAGLGALLMYGVITYGGKATNWASKIVLWQSKSKQ